MGCPGTRNRCNAASGPMVRRCTTATTTANGLAGGGRHPPVREDQPGRRVPGRAELGSPSSRSARPSAPASTASISARSRPTPRPTCSACWAMPASSATAARSGGGDPQRRPRDRAAARVRVAGARYFWGYEVDILEAPEEAHRRGAARLHHRARGDRAVQGPQKRGWKFVGLTTMYAFMQAMGLVNDHQHDCHVRAVVEDARRALPRP